MNHSELLVSGAWNGVPAATAPTPPCTVLHLVVNRDAEAPVHLVGVGINDLVEKYQRDPKKKAAIARARGNLARFLGPQPENALRKLRLQKGLSQAKVAALMGSNQAHVARIESGQDVQVSTLIRFADALGITYLRAFRAFVKAANH